MSHKPQDRCPMCGEEKVVRAWSTHAKTGERFYPVRKVALAFCVNPECGEFRGSKAA